MIWQTMFIVKLGGSVITDKAKQCCFKPEIMNRLSKEINKASQQLILVHGAGSFGHVLAKQYRLNEGYKDDDQLRGFSLTHSMVQQLSSLVLKSLHDHDIEAVAVSPHSILKLENHKPVATNYTIFKEYLDCGFTPVTFGDVVLDKQIRFSICSGDLLVQMLVEQFKPEKVIFVIDEDGLYTSNPKQDPKATLIDSMTSNELEALSTAIDDHADVTRGMKGKIDTIKHIAGLGVDTVLLNGNKPNRLYNILVGKDATCTTVHGGKK